MSEKEAKRHEEELALYLLDIIFMVMHSMAAEMRRTAPTGFEPTQFRVLKALSRRPHILKELAACQQVALPTMSRTVSSLVARGWVARGESPKDRRRLQLRITDKGLAALQELCSRAQQHLAGRLAGLTAEERHQLMTGLEILKKVFATEDTHESN